MLVYKTCTPDATEALGGKLAELLAPGDIVCLSGDLGAGKTLFVQGVVAGLGADATDVTSPTFTIMNVYAARIPVYHFDLYRLENTAALADIGFEEYLGGDGVALIEWADKFPAALPAEYLDIRFTVGDGPTERIITMIPQGTRYLQMSEELKERAGTGFRYCDPSV